MCAKYTVILIIYYLYVKKFSYIQKTFCKKTDDISKAKRQIPKWKEIFTTNYSIDKESMYTTESKKTQTTPTYLKWSKDMKAIHKCAKIKSS